MTQERPWKKKENGDFVRWRVKFHYTILCGDVSSSSIENYVCSTNCSHKKVEREACQTIKRTIMDVAGR